MRRFFLENTGFLPENRDLYPEKSAKTGLSAGAVAKKGRGLPAGAPGGTQEKYPLQLQLTVPLWACYNRGYSSIFGERRGF